MSCTGEEQKRKIAMAARKAESVEVRERDTVTPRLVITGVTKEYLESELIDMILMENEDLEVAFGPDFRENFREVGSRRRRRNSNKENITFETSSDILKHLISKEKVYLDMMMVTVEEAINVSQCYNCNKYGHTAKFCQAQISCQFCGEPHDGRNCRAETKDCINCRTIRVPEEERRHSARDRMCPVYVRKENMARRALNYNH